MSQSRQSDLLARLSAEQHAEDPWAALTASRPETAEQEGAPVVPEGKDGDATLKMLLDRVNRAAREKAGEASAEGELALDGDFVPVEPASFQDARLTESEVEALTLKYLLAVGEASGREIADQTKLPFRLIDVLLQAMKQDQLVGFLRAKAVCFSGNQFQERKAPAPNQPRAG